MVGEPGSNTNICVSQRKQNTKTLFCTYFPGTVLEKAALFVGISSGGTAVAAACKVS
jgi:hypothetical protein